MSDHALDIQSSLLVAGLALVPGNTARYICLTLIFGLLAYHATQGQTPAANINALTAAIASANQLLARALSTSARDQVLSMDEQLRLRINLRAEKMKSQFQCRLLEIEGQGWKEYLRDVRGLLQSISKCTKDVKSIQIKIKLSIEWDTQRKLDEQIQKSREMLAAIHSGHRVCLRVIEDHTPSHKINKAMRI
ncbi:hypothetical protein GGX14DRAFT_587096 [Mycena pura]|uniref:Uncharacterized protein n=1 Tax=Mycena pura TaxID=153505 RepID=A0AAD6V008_9AGAR|nr:hypothetical protein GGX14DRAFT_587096 [Mycena pura]